MAEETAVVVQEVDLEEWRSKQQVAAMGKRIKAMMPGGDKLTDVQAMAAAQYALVMDLNPFRGEVYAYQGRNGQLVIDDGYKALVRWARGKCEYTDRYEPAPGIPEGNIGFRCYILREDKKATMREFIDMGADFKTAYELAAVCADGVVTAGEMWSQKWNKPIDPPTGWTWEQVARKRALKNALNLSHGAPSPKEIASGSWNVNGHETKPEDWEPVTPRMSQDEREAVAEYGAMTREAHEHAGDVTATQASDELFGDYVDAQPIDEEPDADRPETETPAPNWVTNPDLTKNFYVWTAKQMLPNGEAISKPQIYEALGISSSLKEYTGTIGEAKTAINAWIKTGAEAVAE